MTPTFRALIVEDNEADAFLVKKLLDTSSSTMRRLGQFSVEAGRTLAHALARVEHANFDVVLLDLGLPDSQGLDTLRALRAAAPAASVVVFTGTGELELGISALGLGAQDFLLKDELNPAVVVRTLRFAIERRRAEAELLARLREKEVLLKELNHRAKNNLQVVTALLSMQARRSQNDDFRALVEAARGRVEAMARAHEQLNSGSDLSRIDFSGYLRNLAHSIHSSHGGDSRGITLELDVEQHALPLDRAVTAGLIVNELLTNSFKHAFSGDGEGRIWVRLRARAEQLELTLEDNGVGLDNHQSPSSAPLGLGLVATLAEQLDAALERDAGPGTRLRLLFPRGDAA
ncbi:MAG: histidine kinase dimerization/phosphoacceptor domain -containing protein [Polyangiaceae bacterium]